MWDLEKAIGDWRRDLCALPVAAVDELEAHLREELDALAATGLTGEPAFAHATLKLGPTEELVEQIERAAPRAAWRAPAVALLTGVLVYLLGNAIMIVLDWLVIAIGWALRPGPWSVYLGIATFVVLGPFLTIGGGVALAPRIVARVERARAWVRIAVVMAMGLFAMFANLPWLAVLKRHRALTRVWMGWHLMGHEAREAVYWSAPILLALVAIAARRRAVRGSEHARFAFWALAGYALMRLTMATWRLSSGLAAYLAELAGRDMERAATGTAIVGPIVLAMAIYAGSSKLATPSRIVRSSLSEVAGFAVALLAIAAAYGDHALVFGVRYGQPPLDFPLLEAISWSQFGTGIIANLCLAPIAAAGLLRLRSTS